MFDALRMSKGRVLSVHLACKGSTFDAAASMVHFRADEEHFSKSRCSMNELRKYGTFCDISLIVGSQVLKAHRCVLAAGSPYFSVLFLGQFVEASMDEINLSEVTKDMSALEMMLNWLYTGEMDINADNLNAVVKLSSYFLIEAVLEFCKKYMVDTLSLETCLRYHLCAVEYGLTDITARTTPVMEMRFHDFIIFEEEALDIPPKELVSLHQDNMFQFCTPHDMLKFVVDWVKIGLTEQHLCVGTEILDSVSCIKDDDSLEPPVMQSTEDILGAACEETISTVSKTGLIGHEEFIHHISKLCNHCIRTRNSKSGYNCRVSSAANLASASIAEDNENVLITLSPRQCIIDNFDNLEQHTRPYTEDVIDVCGYVPSKGCWYYLKAIDDNLLNSLDLGTLLEMNIDLELDWVLSTTMRSDQLVFAYMKNIDTFVNPHSLNTLVIHDLNRRTFEEFEFDDKVKHYLQENQSWKYKEFCVVAGTANTLYMITAIKCPSQRNSTFEDIFFLGFKFQNSNQCWEVFFQTEKCPLLKFGIKETCIKEGKIHASISTVSNEMLVTYHKNFEADFRIIVFVVDLGTEIPGSTSSSILRVEGKFDETVDYRHVSIVQGKKQFFILYDILQLVGDGQRSIEVKYEYIHHSNTLTAVDTDATELGVAEVIQPRAGYDYWDQGAPTPCLEELNISERESSWYICGDMMRFVSKLTEVTVSANRTPVIKAHPPPPFTCITAAFAGSVSKDVLKQFKPVSFLGKKQLDSEDNFSSSSEEEESSEEV